MAARLLLIEDDASIARFFELALEELPAHDPGAPAVELHVVGSLAQARTALAAGGWQLVVSDLVGNATTATNKAIANSHRVKPLRLPNASSSTAFTAPRFCEAIEATTFSEIFLMISRAISTPTIVPTASCTAVRRRSTDSATVIAIISNEKMISAYVSLSNNDTAFCAAARSSDWNTVI